MPPWTTILVGFAPSLFWLWLVHRRDDHEREPMLLVFAALVLGSASTALVLWLRGWFEATCGPFGHACDAFLVTAFGEELAKTVFVLPVLLMREVDEPLDGIVYGVAAALGFAGVENTLLADTSRELEVVLHRAFTSTLLHAGCTGSIGFAIVCFKLRAFVPAHRSRALLLLPPLCAISLHGAYDWFLIAPVPQVWPALLAVLPVALSLLCLKISWARGQSHSWHPPKP
ncbi:MAG TPA: PrsW family glutamic-type intramembrane protease [Planctomycetota bacterium]